MKFITLCLFFPLLLFVSCNTMGTGNGNEEDKVSNGKLVELIKNGDASNGTDGWGLYAHPPAEGQMSVVNGEIEYAISSTGSDNWHIQGHYAGLTFIQDSKYVLSIDMYSTIAREGQIRIQLDSDPYTAYLEEVIQLTPEKQTFRFEFVMTEKTDEFAKLCFNLGTKAGEELYPHNVYLDNLSILANTGNKDSANSSDIQKSIAINQVGYQSLGIKEVRITEPSEKFMILSSGSNEVVYTGTFNKPIDDSASGEMVYVGNFSDFTQKGSYVIEVPGIGVTESFDINDLVYSDLHNSVLKLLYLQRCGDKLPENIAGAWAHDACHLDLATIYGTDKTLEVSGGWHDAGDYGRYVGPGAKTIADIILSGNLTQEVLDEIKYELDWMLKMQDEVTGGVYHKVTTANFIGSIMPDKSTEELIISPISSTATGQFSAVMAMASREFLDSDPKYANKLVTAAVKAWAWLEHNPTYPGFVNPKGITTGEYGDAIDGDERYWASIELFLTTGEESFHDFAIDTYTQEKWEGLSWIELGEYGSLSYILSDFNKKDNDFDDLLRKDFLAKASTLNSNTDNDGYGISLDTYNWGSNGTVADNGLRLVLASKISGDKKYLDNAERHVHYLLGSNSLGYSYVTGFGDKKVMNSHHRPSNAAHEVMPGMLAGGPNEFLQDPLAKSKLEGQPPQKCYIDAEPSYSTNEITIYWNSAFYSLLTAFIPE